MTTVGVRNTSDRRFSRRGQASRSPVRPAGRAIDTTPGPLAFEGEGAVVCPECLTGLDPAGLKPGEAVPKHARYGHRTNARGNPPCRGWIQQLGPESWGEVSPT